MDRFRIRSGFETIQMLFHSGVVNAQEFVGGGHHVNTIGLSLSTFLIHELVHRLIGGGTLENHAHHQEQCSAQSGGTPFGDAAATDFHLAGLVWRGVDARESHQRFLGVETAHSADLRHKLEPRAGSQHRTSPSQWSTPAAMPPETAFLSAASAVDTAQSWNTACSIRSLVVLALGIILKCPQAEV